jgi:stearoyl-CoA desaturase (delta-9 desaturase)
MTKPPIIKLNVFFFIFTFVVAAFVVPYRAFTTGFDSTEILFAFACFCYCGLSITAGYHRLWSHKTYQAHAIVRFIFALGGAFSFQNSILHWSSDHRVHHKHVDNNDKDPYSAKMGFWYSHIGWMCRHYQAHEYHDYTNVRDLQKDAIVMWQHKYYVLLSFGMNLGVPIAFGLWHGDVINSLLLAGFLRLVLSQHTTFFINSLAHVWGKQTYTDKNTARDNGFLALFTFGEGYHNYHHIFENDYRNGIRWFDYDPTKWLIKSCYYLGLAQKLRKSPEDKIEKAKLAMTLKRTKEKLIVLPNTEKTIMHLQNEYDLLIKKLNDFYQIRKALLQAKGEQVMQEVESSELRAQYLEIKKTLIAQQRNWHLMTAKLA